MPDEAQVISTAVKDKDYYLQLHALKGCRPMFQECMEQRTKIMVRLTKINPDDPYLDRKVIGYREAIRTLDWVMTVLPNIQPKTDIEGLESEHGQD